MRVFGKNANLLLMLLVFLTAQLALAHHASIHFSAHGHIEADAESGKDDHHPQNLDHCRICIISKNLAHALTAQEVAVIKALADTGFMPAAAPAFLPGERPRPYRARAPPALLS